MIIISAMWVAGRERENQNGREEGDTELEKQRLE